MSAEEAMDAVEGERCRFEECSGRVRRQEYKGDDALVCDECGTPAIRTW